MYAGVSTTVNTSSNVVVLDNDNSDIPEWKKLLIMKKRTSIGNVCNDEPSVRKPECMLANVNNRNGDSGMCDNLAAGCVIFGRSTKVVVQDFREISPPKTVTIGNINVELRSVKTSTDSHDSSGDSSTLDRIPFSDCTGILELEDDTCEDLQYGPGIVDRLRAKFLSMGVKKQRKPVVRRFSSLENLPGSNTGPYRTNARGLRQNGFKSVSENYYGSGNVKKAQSMETLISSTPEQHIFAATKRPNTRYVGGVKARILTKNISPITMFTDENEESQENSPSPRVFTKAPKRWDYNRTASVSNINLDELPKPDTVKHVKKIFEYPPLNSNHSSEKSSNHTIGSRFRKCPPTSVGVNGAISGNVRPLVKKLGVMEDSSPDDAKQSAKEIFSNHVNTETEVLPPVSLEVCDETKINKGDYIPLSDKELSGNGSCDTHITEKEFLVDSSIHNNLLILSPETTEEDKESFVKVTTKQLPLESSNHQTLGIEVNGAELPEDEDLSLSEIVVGCSDNGMVVADAASSDTSSKKGTTWQKAPHAPTSIVFDFRGKDVKHNISLQPTPFGCRPANVSRNTTNSKNKRSSSPIRMRNVNGIGLPPKDYDTVDNGEQSNGDDEEDWDEMDIGADLPTSSGIVFSGENVKVGRGAFLETRNKKLTLQFDDHATSTFEYPSENTSPMEEKGDYSNYTFDPSIAKSSEANSRTGLSNYTPQVLTSSNGFELGVSQPKYRPNKFSSPKNEINDIPLDVVIPASPDDAEDWSASGSADILF